MPDLVALQVQLHQQALAALKALATTGWTALPGLIGLAFTFGLIHALLPGHGKLLLATHYAGRGSWRSAIGASIIVILTHVGSAVLIVLSGAALLERGLGRAGRAPALEALSHGLIVIVGLVLFWQSLRRHSSGSGHSHSTSGPLLSFVAGLIPCPLTTFIMTYAIVNNAVSAGLALSAAFASGMVVTVAVLPVISALASARIMATLSSNRLERAVSGIEIASAVLIVALGTALLLR